YILAGSHSTITTEYSYLLANKPDNDFTLFHARERGLEYHIHSFEDKWLILNNQDAQNFRLCQTMDYQTENSNWKELVAHKEETLLERVDVVKGYVILEERTKGLSQIRTINYKTGISDYVDFEAEAYWIGEAENPEFDSEVIRFRYSSFTTPLSTIEYNIRTGAQSVLKQTEVVGGFDEEEYDSERIWATVRDGVQVPISLVWKKDGLRKSRPLLLYAYGSYGSSTPVYFNSARLSLLDRGFVYAVAHIRGGEELGRNWYDTGKMLNKKNTFLDFIDCAEHLIKEGYTDTEQLYAKGGSAGGLLMGAVINYRPELWKGVIAAVPFVDVVTTMLDDTIPLTTFEYDEWGNPNDKKYYKYIKSYSPYDNVEAKDYPNMLVTTGLHDSQVQYWEPAKWVAKLREVKTDENLLLMHCDMEAGHGGATGRFKVHKDTAKEFAFLLMLQATYVAPEVEEEVPSELEEQ
ncbi:MAG: oligopeptidase B, partial [Limisphaerales bacterium]